MKRSILTIGFAAALLSNTLLPVFANFRDVSENSKYFEAVEYLKSNGIVQGYVDGTFRPDDKINRFDFLKIVIGSRFSDTELSACDAKKNSFADIPNDHWCKQYLCIAKEKGIIKGYRNGTFQGFNSITLAEALKIILLCYQIVTDPETEADWQQPYMKKANSLGLLSGISNDPNYQITRGDMAELIFRMNKEAETKTITPTPKATQTPKSSPTSEAQYKRVLATVFWAGEGEEADNGFISNVPSAWEGDWMKNYGGYDDPEDRCEGYIPCAFTPKQNPFYFALPYNDLDEDGERKANAKLIPWYEEKKDRGSVVKNAWIEIKYGNKTAYAQWADVGPFLEDDFDYVFGDAEPKNTQGLGAGLDLSPATYDYLEMPDNDMVSWRFVAEKDVPAGPWKRVTTNSDVNW